MKKCLFMGSDLLARSIFLYCFLMAGGSVHASFRIKTTKEPQSTRQEKTPEITLPAGRPEPSAQKPQEKKPVLVQEGLLPDTPASATTPKQLAEPISRDIHQAPPKPVAEAKKKYSQDEADVLGMLDEFNVDSSSKGNAAAESRKKLAIIEPVQAEISLGEQSSFSAISLGSESSRKEFGLGLKDAFAAMSRLKEAIKNGDPRARSAALAELKTFSVVKDGEYSRALGEIIKELRSLKKKSNVAIGYDIEPKIKELLKEKAIADFGTALVGLVKQRDVDFDGQITRMIELQAKEFPEYSSDVVEDVLKYVNDTYLQQKPPYLDQVLALFKIKFKAQDKGQSAQKQLEERSSNIGDDAQYLPVGSTEQEARRQLKLLNAMGRTPEYVSEQGSRLNSWLEHKRKALEAKIAAPKFSPEIKQVQDFLDKNTGLIVTTDPAQVEPFKKFLNQIQPGQDQAALAKNIKDLRHLQALILDPLYKPMNENFDRPETVVQAAKMIAEKLIALELAAQPQGISSALNVFDRVSRELEMFGVKPEITGDIVQQMSARLALSSKTAADLAQDMAAITRFEKDNSAAATIMAPRLAQLKKDVALRKVIVDRSVVKAKNNALLEIFQLILDLLGKKPRMVEKNIGQAAKELSPVTRDFAKKREEAAGLESEIKQLENALTDKEKPLNVFERAEKETQLKEKKNQLSALQKQSQAAVKGNADKAVALLKEMTTAVENITKEIVDKNKEYLADNVGYKEFKEAAQQQLKDAQVFITYQQEQLKELASQVNLMSDVSVATDASARKDLQALDAQFKKLETALNSAAKKLAVQ